MFPSLIVLLRGDMQSLSICQPAPKLCNSAFCIYRVVQLRQERAPPQLWIHVTEILFSIVVTNNNFKLKMFSM